MYVCMCSITKSKGCTITLHVGKVAPTAVNANRPTNVNKTLPTWATADLPGQCLLTVNGRLASTRVAATSLLICYYMEIPIEAMILYAPRPARQPQL